MPGSVFRNEPASDYNGAGAGPAPDFKRKLRINPLDFTCNLCGTLNTGVEQFGREIPNCAGCQSTVRLRSMMYVLSMELFGVPLPLPDFPVLKSLRGWGMTDPESCARILAEKLDYTNTYFDREPKLDITDLGDRPGGTVDFLISSEVFEHVRPPVETAFQNACRLLRPHGVLILTVPYGPAGAPLEHFPQLSDYGVLQLRGGAVLVNRTAGGELQVFDQLVFHGGSGSTLEMRVLTEEALRSALLGAGFRELKFYGDNYPPFGICHSETWSLPLAARKQPFVVGEAARQELMEHFARLQQRAQRAEQRIGELQAEVDALAAWGHQLEQDAAARSEWARGLERQFEERTAWAMNLQSELEQRKKSLEDLQQQFEERTRWALQLDAESRKLEQELSALRATRWYRLARLFGKTR